MNDILKLFEANVLEGDVVYTPRTVSKGIIDFLKPTGYCLDPCKGDGAFFDYMPIGSKYCELKEGTDFLHCDDKFDWIIGNPPYSIFEQFLKHSFDISDNVSFLVPTNKVFQRQLIMDMINDYGGIRSAVIYGSGSLIGFPFGFSVGNFHFQKHYKGSCELVMGMKQVSRL